jgi:hypothetical protein
MLEGSRRLQPALSREREYHCLPLRQGASSRGPYSKGGGGMPAATLPLSISAAVIVRQSERVGVECWLTFSEAAGKKSQLAVGARTRRIQSL